MSNRSSKTVRRLATAAVLLAALALPRNASATLISLGADLVYDNVLNITWTRNASLPGSTGLSNWQEGKDWADNLVYGGFDDWR